MKNLPEIKSATLLSVEEMETLLADDERIYKRWWWLRSPGRDQNIAASVSIGGSVRYYGNYVDYGSGCVRPALIINFKSSDYKIGDTFVFGDRVFKIISDDLAFCLEDIGCHCFRHDWNAAGANDYERSDIKKFVNAWFEIAMQDEEYQKQEYEYNYLQMASEIDGSL